MQFSEQWLRTWCNPNLDSQQLSHALTMAGLEVEEVNSLATDFSNIVVAKVLTVEPHSNADKLRICTVDIGTQHLQIVCGANNVSAGIKVPCAIVGAKIPLKDGNILTIKVGKLRGIDSFGMLCSANELGLASNVDGLLILPFDAPIGEDIKQYLNLNDKIFTIKLTPNRADCLSIQGIARDVSAITNTTLTPIEIHNYSGNFESKHKVNIDKNSSDLCQRFCGREIQNIDASVDTPLYIKHRLERSGLRSINIIVDISNYVMLELGQPNHMFDSDKLGEKINIHWQANIFPQDLLLLNDTICSIDTKTGVISDEHNIQALAGIMGGMHTSITTSSKNIFIECAFWIPQAIAGKTRHYKLNSDAAYRFERGVDPNLCIQALNRITQLIIENCASAYTKISFIQDIKTSDFNSYHHKSIKINLDKINKVAGIKLEYSTIIDILTRLNLAPQFNEKDNLFSISIPSYRFDLNIAEDIIEEIIRLYGFNNIALRTPIGNLNFLPQATNKRSVHSFRHAIANLGYHEVLNFGFSSEKLETDFSAMPSKLRLKNPIAEQYKVMRSSLIGGLIENLIYNQQQHKPSSIRLFEVGTVFSLVENQATIIEGIYEQQNLAGVANGLAKPLQWGQTKQIIDFYDVKGDIQNLLHNHKLTFKPFNFENSHVALHSGRSAEIYLDDYPSAIGIIGELHPKLIQDYNINVNTIIFELNLDIISKNNIKTIQNINNNPSVKRDIALVVDNNISAQTLIDTLNNLHQHSSWQSDINIFDIQVFDVFKAQENQTNIHTHEKSIALQFFIQKQSSTLSEEEISHIMHLAIEKLQQFGRLRA